jgi:HEAT repeat protein
MQSRMPFSVDDVTGRQPFQSFCVILATVVLLVSVSGCGKKPDPTTQSEVATRKSRVSAATPTDFPAQAPPPQVNITPPQLRSPRAAPTKPETIDVDSLASKLNDPSVSADDLKHTIESLARAGTPKAISALAAFLNDSSKSSDLRMEAATALGTVEAQGATEALANAAFTIQDPDIVTEILDSLGTRDFAQTQSFFLNYLHSPSVSSELRTAAVESLWQAKGDPSAFLLTLATDADAEVRSSAAWALSATESNGTVGSQLLSLLQNEIDPDVRLRLYQALANQDGLDANTVLSTIRNEQSPGARVAALDLLARLLRQSSTPELQNFFDQTAVPELKQTALSAQSQQQGNMAIIALARSGDSYAQSALQEISQTSTDPRIKNSATTALGMFVKRP